MAIYYIFIGYVPGNQVHFVDAEPLVDVASHFEPEPGDELWSVEIDMRDKRGGLEIVVRLVELVDCIAIGDILDKLGLGCLILLNVDAEL